MLTLLEVLPTLLTVSLTAVIIFMLFQYMHTEIPEGVKEVWGARILDTALRTNGKFVSFVRRFFFFRNLHDTHKSRIEIKLVLKIRPKSEFQISVKHSQFIF